MERSVVGMKGNIRLRRLGGLEKSGRWLAGRGGWPDEEVGKIGRLVGSARLEGLGGWEG